MMDYAILAGFGFVVGVATWWLASRLQLIALQTQRDHLQRRAAQMETLVGELRRRLAEAELRLRQAAAARPEDPTVPTGASEHSRLRQLEDDLAQARQRVTMLQAQLSTVKGTLPRLEDDIVQARQRAAAAEAINQERLADMEAAQKRAKALQARLEQAAERIDQLERELEQARARRRPEDQPAQPPGIKIPVEARSSPPHRLAVEDLSVVSEAAAALDEMPQTLRVSETLRSSGEAEGATPPAEVEAYCVKCRTKRVMADPQPVLMANERPACKGICPECGTTMFRFVKGTHKI